MNISQMELVIAAGILLITLGAVEVGFLLGRTVNKRSGDGPLSHLSTIQGAMLGILGLLLAFCFSLAQTHAVNRQHLIVDESNAISSTAMKLELTSVASRQRILPLLHEYVKTDVAFFNSQDKAESAALKKKMDETILLVWRESVSAVQGNAIAAHQVLPAVEKISDLHSTRMMAAQTHLSPVVIGVLLLTAVLAISTIGLGCGIAGKRQVLLPFMLALMVTALLCVILDLDHPRNGFIRANQTCIIQLDEALAGQISALPGEGR